MNQPWVCMCSPSWPSLLPPSRSHLWVIPVHQPSGGFLSTEPSRKSSSTFVYNTYHDKSNILHMACKVLLCLVCLALPPGQLPCLLISSSTIPSSASRTSCLLAFAWDALNPPVFSWRVITNLLHFSLNVTSSDSFPDNIPSPFKLGHSVIFLLLDCSFKTFFQSIVTYLLMICLISISPLECKL